MDLLKQLLLEHDFPLEKIYNVNKSRVTSVQKSGRVLVQKGNKQVGHITRAELGKTVTLLCAMSAIDNYIPSD